MRGGVKHSPFLRTLEIRQKSSKINDFLNEQGNVWRLLKASGVTRDDVSPHAISWKLISRSRFSQDLQDSEKIGAVFLPLWSDSEPGVDTVGIYVENHSNRCREIFIWIRFDHRRLGEKGSPPLLLEDPLISETCPLEESASHHFVVWEL